MRIRFVLPIAAAVLVGSSASATFADGIDWSKYPDVKPAQCTAPGGWVKAGRHADSGVCNEGQSRNAAKASETTSHQRSSPVA